MQNEFDFDFDELELKAYKLCLIWIDKSRKIFPRYKHTAMKSGDPRKSLMFKVCYKLVRETQGVLKEDEYPLYIRAQLDVLRHIYINNTRKTQPLIDANCLVGDKAWKRWKLWKNKYDSISSKPSEVSQPIGPGTIKALEGIERTREFFAKTFGANPTIEKYRESYINNNLFRWINFGKISPYYIAMSPYIASTLKPEDYKRINFDPDLYKPCITDEVIKKFKEIFFYEF